MIEIDYRDVPAYMRRGARGIKIAGVQTLNTVAIQALPAMVEESQEKMTIKGNARGALGWFINKATTAHPEVSITTKRKWLIPHMEEGTRRPRSGGWKWKGQEYLVIPILKAAFGKGGRLKSGYLNNFYVVPKGKQGLVYYRKKRGDKTSELIAILTPDAATHKDTDPKSVIDFRWNRDATKLLRRYLADPRYKANPNGVF